MIEFIYTVLVLCNSHNPEYPHKIKYDSLTKERVDYITNYYDTLTTNKVYTYTIDSVAYKKKI